MPDRDPTTHLQYAFVRDGRLTSLPKRTPMLLAACAFLAEDGPDHATLRRLLVDEGFLRRAGGTYRREA